MGDSTADATVDITRLIAIADQVLTNSDGTPQLVQDLTVICKALDDAYDGRWVTTDKVFKNTYVTDAQVDIITGLIPIPISTGYPNTSHANVHEAQTFSALLLLRLIAEEAANTEVFLASHAHACPLLKLQSSIQFGYARGQTLSHFTLKNILLVLVRLHNSLTPLCTQITRAQASRHNGNPPCSLDHHGMVAWMAIQHHVFAEATEEALKCQRLEAALNMDYGRLLAKVIITLRDVLGPLKQQHDVGHGTTPCPSTSIYDGARNSNSGASVNNMHTQGQGCKLAEQKGSQAAALQHTTQIQSSRASPCDRNTQTPRTSCDITGVTDRRFTGRVVCFDAAKNFGFISCSELWNVFSKDTWVHREQLRGFFVGQEVSFEVVINKDGHPQAVHLTSLARIEFDPNLCYSV